MFNYDNIGEKIKNLAKPLFLISVTLYTVIGAFWIIFDDNMVLSGLMIILLGIISARILTCLLYGFGQLIENSDIIAQQFKQNDEIYEEIDPDITQLKKQRNIGVSTFIADKTIDEDVIVNFICPNCKKKLSCTKKQIKNDEITSCPMCDAPISFELSQT